jgi:hypothetical protein
MKTASPNRLDMNMIVLGLNRITGATVFGCATHDEMD